MESQPDSLVYFVRAHLYRKLERDGVNFILDWSTSKDIDVHHHCTTKRIYLKTYGYG